MNFPFILDGATGTELTKRGMPQGGCTESFVLENPEVLQKLQTEYIQAGADGVLAPTFGANRPTLLRHGFKEEEITDTCKRLYAISKEAAKDKAVIADLSPTGLLLKPFGTAEPDDVFSYYKEQAQILTECGADIFDIETMISAAEARLAVMAVRQVNKDAKILVTLTVTENGKTVYGDSPAATLISLLPYNISGFGCNCSIGPDVIYNALKPVAPIAKRFNIPLIAKPNAGMPVTDEKGIHYPLTPSDMAEYIDKLTGLGVRIFGGCCGTTPAHIEAIAKAAKESKVIPFADTDMAPDGNYISTSRRYALLGEGEYIKVNADNEDDIYDLLDEYEEDEALYFELEEGGADLLISMDAFIPNPYAVRGPETEIQKLEMALCRKIK